jgi:hypothetical protein
MDQATPSTISASTLHCALESSKKSWLLGDPVSGSGAVEPLFDRRRGRGKLMLKLTAARDRWAKVSDALTIVTLCYEVRYDAFWLVVAKLRARHIGRPIAVVFPRQWSACGFH